MSCNGARSSAGQKFDLRNLHLDRGYAELRERGKKMRQVKLTPETIEALGAQVAKLHESHQRAHGCDAPPETLVFEVTTRWGISQLMKRLQKRAHRYAREMKGSTLSRLKKLPRRISTRAASVLISPHSSIGIPTVPSLAVKVPHRSSLAVKVPYR
jgi:site-specific recombinase XerC